MERYRKRPVIIDAIQFTEETATEVGELLGVSVYVAGPYFEDKPRGTALWADIKTLEGTMTAQMGDWIIRGIQGELYPCKDSIFQATYESAEGDT